MTQDERVLRHLRDYGSITSWEAITEYGITRISARIFTLRQKGYNIESETINAKNRYGENTHFAKYILKGVENE